MWKEEEKEENGGIWLVVVVVAVRVGVRGREVCMRSNVITFSLFPRRHLADQRRTTLSSSFYNDDDVWCEQDHSRQEPANPCSTGFSTWQW